MSHKPEVVSNRHGTVADAIGGYWDHFLTHRPDDLALAIASAYFNPGGFKLLADRLEAATKVRLLIGAEPDVAADMFRRRSLAASRPGQTMKARLAEALKEHLAEIEVDRDLIAFTPDNDALVERLIAWLRSDAVETRRLTSQFLHGKAYILETDSEGVVAGSSNFTYAGLARNVELNLGHYEPYKVKQVQDWFEELWDEAEAYDLARLYERRFDDHQPWIVFLRMLYERYGDDLDVTDEPFGIPMLTFQAEGVLRARRFLARYKGVVIADGVGLGKTYTAGQLMWEAVHDRRQRVLLIAPAALRDGPWRKFLAEHDLKAVQCISYEQLCNDIRLGGHAEVLDHDPDDYAMVVIDEAHAYRNTGTERSEVLRELLKGSPQKDLVLLTATPVNNSLMDLYNLLAYFIRNDGEFIHAGIPSLRKHFAAAQAADPEDLSPDLLFDVLDAVAVRRTRRFIKKHYAGMELPGLGPIRFPEPKVARVDYDLDAVIPGFFNDFAHALGMDPDDPDTPIPTPDQFDYQAGQLTLARYAPSAFLSDPDAEPEAYEMQAAGLLRSGLLKRFESSSAAFAKTCRKMAASHDLFLDALDDGWVLTGDALAEYARTDTDYDPADYDGGGTRGDVADYDLDDLRAAVQADKDLLEAFAERAEAIGVADDPKLDALIEELAAVAEQAATDGLTPQAQQDNRKVLLFSYYGDTVDWIMERLADAVATDPRLAAYNGRITSVTGDDGDKKDAMYGFAPRTAGAPDGWTDGYDILVATDVLAEGVNLQQARHIINYDLPWNPMRLVQRHGRIDRIGSPHAKVWMRCFFPADVLDDLLGLEARIQRKIAQAAASIGVEDEIIPDSAVAEVVLAHTKEQIQAIHDEDAALLDDDNAPGALSGEEFRKILADAMDNATTRGKVLGLPWVAGSGFRSAGNPGYVFCARVGDHPEAVFRWVPVNPDGTTIVEADGTTIVSDQTLQAIARAQCEPATDLDLPDSAREGAYAAWAAARDDIQAEWAKLSDPTSVVVPVPKTMRRAKEILIAHPPAGVTQDKLDWYDEALSAPYDHRTQRILRQAILDHDKPADQAAEVVKVIHDLGLEPQPEIQPLPEIEAADIYLVCWMAVLPEQQTEDGPADVLFEDPDSLLGQA